MAKKAISLLLALMLCLSLLPVGVWADDEATEAVTQEPEQTEQVEVVEESTEAPGEETATELFDNEITDEPGEESAESGEDEVTGRDEETVEEADYILDDPDETGTEEKLSEDETASEEPVADESEELVLDGAGTVSKDSIEKAITYCRNIMNDPAEAATWAGWCAALVWEAYNKGAGIGNRSYDTARQMGNALINHTDSNPPRGAFVFWADSSAPTTSAGHVGLALGDGTVIHAFGGTVKINKITYVNSCGYTYRGWGPPIAGYTLATQSTNYLDQCTVYPSYLTVRVTGSTTMNSYPTSTTSDAGVAAGSKVVYNASEGEVFTVTGLYMNTYGNLWYRTQANGTTCYLVANKTEVVNKLYHDVTASGVTVPGTWKKGTSFYIAGTVKSTNNTMIRLDGYILQGSTQKYHTNSGTVSTRSYNLKNSKVDDGLIFSECAVGSYTYRVTAQVKNYYSANSEGKTVASETKTITVIDSPFTISTTGTTTATTLSNYYIDINGNLDGEDSGKLTGYGTVDVYINGVLVANDVDDYYVQWPTGTKYEIKDIKPVGDYTYVGLKEGALTGTVGSSAINIRMIFNSERKISTYTYNANGGTGAPASHTAPFMEIITLSNVIPTRVGCTFLGWSCSMAALDYPFDESLVQYQPGDSCYNASEEYDELMFFAIWKLNTYTVAYDANGGTGAPASQTKTYGTALTLSGTKPTRDNYTFLGWSTVKTATAAAYQPGGSYSEEADTTLYAVWKYIEPVSTEPTISVSSATVKPGGTVTVTVSLKNNPGIAGLSFQIDYDHTKFELVEATDAGLNGWTVGVGGGEVAVWDSASDSSFNGGALTLTFKALSSTIGDSTMISLKNISGADLNEQEVEFTSAAGTLTVQNRMPGDVTGDGKVTITDLIRMRKFLAGMSVEFDTSAGDVTGDGKVTITDVIRMRKFLAGMDVVLQ